MVRLGGIATLVVMRQLSADVTPSQDRHRGHGTSRRAGILAVGQGLVEYGLVIALIAVLAIGALLYLGGQVSDSLSTTGKAIQSVGAAGPGPSSQPTPPPSDYTTKKACTAAGFQWVTKPKPAHCE